MSHPKDAPIDFELNSPRLTRGRRARGAGAGSAPPAYPPPVQELFVLPLGGQGVHLSRALDCPRCLEHAPPGVACGVVAVSFSLHYAELPREMGGNGAVGIGMTATPRLEAGPRVSDGMGGWSEPVPRVTTGCTKGCELTRDEWEVVLGAAFLDVCAEYAKTTKG